MVIIYYFISAKLKKKKKKKQLIELSLVPEVEILKFYEGACSASEFAEVICSYLSQYVEEYSNDMEADIQKLCWKKYSEVCIIIVLCLMYMSEHNVFKLIIIN